VPVGAQPLVAGAGVVHDRAGDHHHPVPGEARAAAELEAVAEGPEGRIRAAEAVPHVAADQRAGEPDGEHVVDGVVLALVDLVVVDGVEAAGGRGGADPHLEEALGLRPVALLGTGHRDGGPGLRGAEQEVEGLGRGRGIVMEEPQPARGGVVADHGDLAGTGLVQLVGALLGLGVQFQALPDRVTEGAGPRGVDDADLAAGVQSDLGDERLEGVPRAQIPAGGPDVHDHHAGGDVRLRGDPLEGAPQVAGGAARDDDRRRLRAGVAMGHGFGWRRPQTARRFILRRSRSDSPPQMPKRSSFASA